MKVGPKELSKHGYVLTQMWAAEDRGGSDKPGRIWIHRTLPSVLRHFVRMIVLEESQAGLKILSPNGGSILSDSGGRANISREDFKVVLEETKRIKEILDRAGVRLGRDSNGCRTGSKSCQKVLERNGIKEVTPFYEKYEGLKKQGVQEGLDLVDPDQQEIAAEQKDQYVLIKRIFEPVGGKEKGQEVIIPKGDPIKAFLTGIEQINQDNETLTLYRIRNGKSEPIRSTSSGIMQQKEGA